MSEENTNKLENSATESSENEEVAENLENEHAQKKRPVHAFVVLLMILLFVGTVIVVVVIPPGGSQPVSTTSSEQFAMYQTTVLRTAGSSEERVQLRYASLGEGIDYQLFIQEENQYPQGELVKTEFRARVKLESGSNKTAGSVYLTLEDVSLSVKDGAEEKDLAGLDAMLEGIIFEGVLDAQKGLSRLIPRAKINPQVGRVLYIVTDLMRYAFIPLPEGEVGVAANWQSVLKDSKVDKESVIIDTMKKGKSEYQMDMRRMSDNIQLGNGTGVLKLEEGVVEELKGTLKSTLPTDTAEKASHTVVFGLTKSEHLKKIE